MKAIVNSKDCPQCGSNHKTKPFCTYVDGERCFSCGYARWFDRSFLFIERKPIIPEFPEATSQFNAFSLEAQRWLLQYNITEEVAKTYKIHYSDDNSLIFPMFVDDVLVCYQKRNMLERIITTYGQKLPYTLNNAHNVHIIVVVEDVISAIRINQAGYSVLCLWGTKLPYNNLLECFKKHDIVVMWLDNDADKEVNSGQVAAKKSVEIGENILRQKYGYSIKKRILNIATEEDPKAYSNTEICKYIGEAFSYE